MKTDPSTPHPGKSLRSALKGEAKDALIFSASNFLNKFAAFFLLPFYWKKLTPEDYGVIAVIAMIGQFQSILGNMAMEGGVTRFHYEWPEASRRRSLGALWTWNWISNAVWSAVFLLGMPVVFPLLFPGVPFYSEVFLGLVATSLAGLYVLPFMTIRIKRLPWVFAACNFASFAVTSGFGIYFVLIRDAKLHGYILSTIWSSAIIALVGAAVMLRFSRPCFSAPGLRECVRFSYHTVPSQLIDGFGSMLDRYLLAYFSSLQALGIYAVSMKFVDIISALHSSLKMAYGPFLMKTMAEDKERGRELVAGVTPFYTFAYLFVGLCLSIFIGDFVRFVNQAEYLPVLQWVPAIVGISIINTLYVYYTPGIILSKRTGLLWIPSALNLSVLAVAAYPLISRFGLHGLVATRYASAILFFIANLIISQRVFPFPHQWGRLGALVALGMACAFLGIWADRLGTAPGIAVKTLIAGGFCWICLKFLLKSDGQIAPPLPFFRRKASTVGTGNEP